MGLFDKVTKTATNLGNSMVNSAAKVGSSVTVAAQEQQELISLKSQVRTSFRLSAVQRQRTMTARQTICLRYTMQCSSWITSCSAPPLCSSPYYDSFLLFMDVNTKTGSAIISVIPMILTAISGNSIPIILQTAKIRVIMEITKRLMHQSKVYFLSTVCPP